MSTSPDSDQRSAPAERGNNQASFPPYTPTDLHTAAPLGVATLRIVDADSAQGFVIINASDFDANTMTVYEP